MLSLPRPVRSATGSCLAISLGAQDIRSTDHWFDWPLPDCHALVSASTQVCVFWRCSACIYTITNTCKSLPKWHNFTNNSLTSIAIWESFHWNKIIHLRSGLEWKGSKTANVQWPVFFIGMQKLVREFRFHSCLSKYSGEGNNWKMWKTISFLDLLKPQLEP